MSPPNFINTLNHYKDILWPVIESYLQELKNFPKHCHLDSEYQSIVDFHFDMTTDYPKRKGKYLRPSLLLLTAQSMGVNLEQALITAAAMQISEDWILGHDDVEDQSEQRRGLPALQKIYGDHLAINAGDSLHVLMWRVLGQNFSLLPLTTAQKIYNEFFIMLNRTILGQTIEIKWTKDNRFDLSQKDILLISQSKTGYYTIAGPMRLGAILAGANQKQLTSLYNFGISLGLAFQIIDDLLDLTSTFSGLKNQIGNDIYEGKRTIMLFHLLNQLDSTTKTKLIKILSKSRSQKTQTEVLWVIDQMKRLGSLDYGRNLANNFAAKARKIFDTQLQFLDQEPFRSQLQSGIDFIVSRNQ